jgi:DNA repair protein SbcD/Mre11
LVGNATRRALVTIVDLCLDEQVDALLLAGDLYDGDQTSMKTARFLATQLRRLDEAGIRTFVIRGNHDALSRITRELVLPETVKVFGGRAEAITIERDSGSVPIVVHGLSFAQPHAPEGLLPRYKTLVEGAVNIGLMHTSLAGSAGHDPYAPCSVADLQATGFRYWALGHIHKRSVVEGTCAVVMPGMPQGRDVNEAGPKSVTLVTVADDGAITIDERLTSLAQFERVGVDLTGIEDWRDIAAAITRTLEHARSVAISEHLVARLSLTGTTPLAWRARRDTDLLRTEAAERASVVGNCWIEKLDVECTPPSAVAGPVSDPVVELRQLIDSDVIRSEAYRSEAVRLVDELRGQLPPECRHLLGTDEGSFAAVLEALARAGADDVLARLHAGPAEEAG